MNHLPDLRNSIWFLHAIDEPPRNLRLPRETFCPAKRLFRLLILQVRIDHLKHARRSSWRGFTGTNIQEYYRLTISIIDRITDNCIIALITGRKHGQYRIWETTLD